MAGPELEPNHPRKPRASKPKVKSGCYTCKVRRVKCDETKPDCLRCANFGRKCAGYESKEDTPPRESIPHMKRRLFPKTSSPDVVVKPPVLSDLSLVLRPLDPPSFYCTPVPPETGYQDNPELQYLCYFRDVTAIDLSGGFSPTMWNSVILQACDSPEIRRLVIATAAMSMAVAHQAEISEMHWNTESESHRQYALQQYGEALKAIQRQIVVSSADSVKTAMISSLLIFCFEGLQEEAAPTMIHIQSALEIIVKRLSSAPYTYQISSVSSIGSQSNAPIHDALLLAFIRIYRPSLSLLCLQKGQLLRPAGRLFNLIFPTEPFEIPMKFSGIEEARIYLDDIRWRMFPCSQAPDFMSSLWKNDKQEDLSPDLGAVPWHAQQWYQSYETTQESVFRSQRLVLWHDAFSPLLNYAMTQAGEAIFIAAVILHIQAMSTELVLTGFFPPSFTKQRSSSFFNFQSAFPTKLEPIPPTSQGSLSVPPSDSSHRRSRSSSYSAPQPTQENMTLFPTVHAILSFSRRLVAHPAFSKRFVFDHGIISSLSLVVMLCPDRGLRREAVEVLRSMRPRREGVWDSRVCAEAGEKLLVKEEMEMKVIDPLLR